MSLNNSVAISRVNTSDEATVTGGSNIQQSSNSAALSSGGYVVIYEDESQDTDSTSVGPGETRILAQMYNADGSRNGSEIVVIANNIGDQRLPNVAGHPDGGFIIVSQDFDTATDRDIEIRRYDSAGSPTNSNNISPSDDDTDPTIAVFSNGSYAVIHTRQDGTDTDIVARIYDSDNVELSGGPFILGNLGTDEITPRAVQLSNGNIAVSIQEVINATDNDPNFAILQSNGTVIGFNSNVSNSSADQTDVTIAALTGGGFVVVFTNSGTNIEFGIRANDGSEVRAISSAETLTDGNQSDLEIVGLADGGFLITFRDDFLSRIVGQRFDANGDTIGEIFNITPISSNIISNDSLALLEDGRVAFTFTSSLTLSSPNPDVRIGALEFQPATVDLSDLDGVNGFTINGINVFDLSGESVSSAGDVNGDGIDDILVSDDGANGGCW